MGLAIQQVHAICVHNHYAADRLNWADASAAPWWVETQAFLCAKGNVTTTTDGQLIVGCGNSMTYAASQLTAGTGFTIRQTHFSDNPMEDRIQTSAGSIAATFTSNSATNNYNPIIGTFTSSASGTVKPSGKVTFR